MIVRSMVIATMVALTGASAGQAQTSLRPWDCGGDPPGSLRWLVSPNIAQAGMVVSEYTSGQGYGRVQCVLNGSGRPKDCVVLYETPAGKNFGKMAGEIAGLYKAASKDSLGRPTKGRKVCHGFNSSGRADGGPTG